MPETIDSLVLEHLHAMRADIVDLKHDMREIRSEVISLRVVMGEFIKADA